MRDLGFVGELFLMYQESLIPQMGDVGLNVWGEFRSLVSFMETKSQGPRLKRAIGKMLLAVAILAFAVNLGYSQRDYEVSRREKER